jgi:hypothetical protein
MRRLGNGASARHIVKMSENSPSTAKPVLASVPRRPADAAAKSAAGPREIGGPKGPEPTRYGDWEVNGRCSDF